MTRGNGSARFRRAAVRSASLLLVLSSLLAGGAAAAGSGAAESAAAPVARRLMSLSIEELADVEVTTVSRRSESRLVAAAAVYVINRGYEDLATRLNSLGASIETFRDI